MDPKPTTVLTNLQRGNIEAKIATTCELNFYQKCGQGEVSDENIRSRKNIDEPDSEGFSALHYAAFYGQLKTCASLLDAGASPNVMARNYIAPLHLAASHGHHEIIRLLISKVIRVFSK